MGFQGGAGTSCRYHTGGRLGGEPGPPKHRRAAEGCPRAKGVTRADAGWAPRATCPPQGECPVPMAALPSVRGHDRRGGAGRVGESRDTGLDPAGVSECAGSPHIQAESHPCRW